MAKKEWKNHLKDMMNWSIPVLGPLVRGGKDISRLKWEVLLLVVMNGRWLGWSALLVLWKGKKMNRSMDPVKKDEIISYPKVGSKLICKRYICKSGVYNCDNKIYIGRTFTTVFARLCEHKRTYQTQNIYFSSWMF